MMAEEATQIDDVPTTSAATQMNFIELLFDGREFILTAKIQNWKFVVAHYKNEVKRVQEQFSQPILEYID